MINEKLLLEQYDKAKAKKSPLRPRVDTKDLTIIDEAGFLKRKELASFAVTNIHINCRDLPDRAYTRCTFSANSFSECNMSGTVFEDVVFSHCDFSNTDFTSAGFKRCAFENCKLTGASFSDSFFENVSLHDNVFSYALFGRSIWKAVNAISCNFSCADMTDMKLSSVSLDSCKLMGTTLFRTSLTGIDFTTCQLEGIVVSDSLSEVYGCKMSVLQLSSFARMLGILIDS